VVKKVATFQAHYTIMKWREVMQYSDNGDGLVRNILSHGFTMKRSDLLKLVTQPFFTDITCSSGKGEETLLT